MAEKYPNPKCDEACYYHCTQGGKQQPECVTENKTMADLGRIYDIISNNELDKHKKIVNIWKLSNNIKYFPKLPPLICPCEITLNNGSKYRAYLDQEISQDWIEYGNTFAIRRNGRRQWKQEDVKEWKLI
jgi:hypothetical protein